MLDQGMFRNHFVGRDGFIWWIGQIADENTWKANIPGFPAPTNESTEGESIGLVKDIKFVLWGIILLLHQNLQMKNYHGQQSCILLLLVVEVEDHLKMQT